MAIVWFHEEYKSRDDLVSLTDYAKEHGLDNKSAPNWLRRYADLAPEMVAADGRARIYARPELDAFFVAVEKTKKPRSPAEVAKAEAIHLRRSIEDERRQEDEYLKHLRVAKKNLKVAQESVKKRETEVRATRARIRKREEQLRMAQTREQLYRE